MGKFGWLAVGVTAIGLWIVLFVSANLTTDPDFGWHLRVGKMLWENSLPETDPFSYTMPSWRWVDHGRLTDMGIYWLYEHVGKIGLAAVSATMVLTALAIAIPNNLKPWAIVPIFLGFGVLFTRSGVRPQIEDWIGLVILLRMLDEKRIWNKWRWLVPIIFAMWANLHGGFVVGLIVMFVAIGAELVLKRQLDGKDVMVLVLSVLSTLLTPYHFRLWEEIWLTMSDTHLRSAIIEWQPFFVRVEMGFWFLVALIVTLAKIKPKIVTSTTQVILAVLLLAAVSGLRNMPMFVLAGVPVAAKGLKEMWKDFSLHKEKSRRAKIFYGVLIAMSLVVFAIEVGVPMGKIFRRKWLNYPEQAVEYLKTEGYPGRIFSEYGWGGYLIWEMPEEKVFIDGRMPSWRWKAPEGESDWAFKEYEEARNEDFEKLFLKYGVRTVLWSKPNALAGAGGWRWLMSQPEKKEPSLPERLRIAGWELVYEDEITVIFFHPDE